ncbi:MAG: hypothetical protein WAM14_24385 [Candidatus Nitrosopolaris sp.]
MKGKTGKPIRGISQHKYLLAEYNNENEVRVNQIIAELNEAFKIVTAPVLYYCHNFNMSHRSIQSTQ